MTTDTHPEHPEHTAHDGRTPHGGHDDKEHWTDLQYVQLALGAGGVTAVEVALSYMKDDFGVVLPARCC